MFTSTEVVIWVNESPFYAALQVWSSSSSGCIHVLAWPRSFKRFGNKNEKREGYPCIIKADWRQEANNCEVIEWLKYTVWQQQPLADQILSNFVWMTTTDLQSLQQQKRSSLPRLPFCPCFSNLEKHHTYKGSKDCDINWPSGKGSWTEDIYWFLTKQCYISYCSEHVAQVFCCYLFVFGAMCQNKCWSRTICSWACLSTAFSFQFFRFFHFISIVSVWTKEQNNLLNI